MMTSDARARFALLAILACAASLRLWALGAGIPYAIGIDEPQILNRALTMMRSGDFHPYFFDYPTLYIYLQLAVACLRFMTGAVAGAWDSLAEVRLADLVLWGRALTAVLGTLTVLAVYRIGLRWSTRHALLAAGLLAVLPMHVRESHFILTDVPLTFFVALTFLLSLRAHERPDLSAFAWAGAAAGLAAGTKYPGALAVLLPLLTALSTRGAKRSRPQSAAAVVLGAAAAFLVVAPYTLLDLPAFLDGFGILMGSYTGAPPPEPGSILYLKHLRRGTSLPTFIAIAGGLLVAIAAVRHDTGRLRWILTLVFPLVYFLFISRQTLVFGRYLLPVFPFAALLAASAVIAAANAITRITERRPLRIAAATALTVAVAMPPLLSSVAWNRNHARTTTMALAHEWIERHIPRDVRLAVEGTDLSLEFSGYAVLRVGQLRHKPLEEYLANGAEYLVASSQAYGAYLDDPQRFPNHAGYYQDLFARGEEVVRFTPSEEVGGPELRILKVVEPVSSDSR